MPDSPAIQKLKDLSSHRTFNTKRNRNIRRPLSITRRVHCGWMHKKKNMGVFSRVVGTKNLIDIDKKATLQEVKDIFLNLYFPDDENKIQGVSLNEVEHYIGNYAGAPLSNILKNGKEFSLENYYEEIRTSPIRLYLFTCQKDPGGINNDDLLSIHKRTSTPVS